MDDRPLVINSASYMRGQLHLSAGALFKVPDEGLIGFEVVREGYCGLGHK